ncbi:hypothetical protein PHYSODRAFT_334321 [Phytophthora sojae]|uniref:Uncharacterized protein n=1 Tax=Phytophthora sojae (strain P6497) TaxID=1094619 RepID=G4ZPR8_PHYSP|nr:hypothetical protein PHYSODRAFT_334321 [Phytophthora sojae]EGZ16130.1 hypothetical protein PHYSODRAFT_334321 [Phytophthora sojae]|eukprot:XP_009529879.1 hypothetical protein PHYSODRAFT_334321 [Phytophthora sojae]
MPPRARRAQPPQPDRELVRCVFRLFGSRRSDLDGTTTLSARRPSYCQDGHSGRFIHSLRWPGELRRRGRYYSSTTLLDRATRQCHRVAPQQCRREGDKRRAAGTAHAGRLKGDKKR